jgi:sugar phosphate isomerase/epimerase
VVTLSFPTVNCLQMPLAGRPPVPSVLRPLDEVLAGVAAAGFSHVGIDNFSVQDHVERGADLTGVGQLLERLGLSCSDVGVLQIGEPAPTAEAARAMAALAGSTGASICTTAMEVEPGAAAVQTLRRCADVLAPQGVRMALEFLPYSPLSTLRSARELCATVGWDLCGVLIDSWMFFRGDNSFADLEDMTAKEIGYVQFDDAPEPVGVASHRRGEGPRAPLRGLGRGIRPEFRQRGRPAQGTRKPGVGRRRRTGRRHAGPSHRGDWPGEGNVRRLRPDRQGQE